MIAGTRVAGRGSGLRVLATDRLGSKSARLATGPFAVENYG